jgi:hypothetical protein
VKGNRAELPTHAAEGRDDVFKHPHMKEQLHYFLNGLHVVLQKRWIIMHYLLVVLFFVSICKAVYLIVQMQGTFHVSTQASRPILYLMIAYLYCWWFTSFENVPFKIWKTNRHTVYTIAMRLLYFALFVLEVALSIFIMTTFDGIYLRIWAISVAVFVFFILYRIKRTIESTLKKAESNARSSGKRMWRAGPASRPR